MASLLHVLSKPELQGDIQMTEFEIIMADFGITETKPDTPLISPRGERGSRASGSSQVQFIQRNTPEPPPTDDSMDFGLVASKLEAKPKNEKKDSITGMLRTSPQVTRELSTVLQSASVDDLMTAIKAKAFKKTFKVAGKSSQASVIKQSDFKEICSNSNLSEEFFASIQEKVQLSPKFSGFY